MDIMQDKKETSGSAHGTVEEYGDMMEPSLPTSFHLLIIIHPLKMNAVMLLPPLQNMFILRNTSVMI